MDFIPEIQKDQIRSWAREFAEREIAPIASEIDRTGTLPRSLWTKIGENKILGINYPNEYGGLGADYISALVALEEISRVSAGVAGCIEAVAYLACGAIFDFGTEQQKKKFLPPLLSGEKVGFFATTEPNASSDPMSIETRGILDGGSWVLNGTKRFISNAPWADLGVAFVKTGERALSAFVVETDRQGVSVGQREETIGVRGQEIADLIFQDVRVPKENLIGTEGKGMKVALATLDGGRIGIGVLAVGIGEAALEESIEYAKERKQFGKPIAFFQAIQFYLADMAMSVNAAKSIVYQAGHLRQTGVPHTKEAAMAKCVATEMAGDVTRRAVQIHGGYGCTKSAKVERLYRDAKVTEIYEGTNEIQRIVIARALLGREYVTI